MRFPSRPVLAASVLAALAASGGTVLTMPDQVADAAESGTALPAGPGLRAQDPSEAPTVAGPPVSGAQIAGLALAPARERAGRLIAERAAEEAAARAAEEKARQEAAQQEQADQHRRPGADNWKEWRRQLHQACQDGRIRGQICRGA